MNSFKVSAVGNLAKDPSLVKKGGKEFCRFCLVGNDYAGKDEQGEATEVTTAVWFVAFNGMAKAIGHARKGDQLVVDAHIRANNYQAQDSDETVYELQLHRGRVPVRGSGVTALSERGTSRPESGSGNSRACADRRKSASTFSTLPLV